MSLHYLVKYECQKIRYDTRCYFNVRSKADISQLNYRTENWRQSEICIVINNKSLDSTANHLSCDELPHYKFITQFAGERIFKIGGHLPKLQAKWLVVSYDQFTLDFCLRRCRTRQISKIT